MNDQVRRSEDGRVIFNHRYIQAKHPLVLDIMEGTGKEVGPPWMRCSIIHEVVCGSHAYGMDVPDSDVDIVAIAVPPPEIMYPHLVGEIPGFPLPYGLEGRDISQVQRMLTDKDGVQYDISIYTLGKFANLAVKGSPNIITSLYVPQSHITWTTEAGRNLQSCRREFLSMSCVRACIGYVDSIRRRMRNDGRYKNKMLAHAFRLYLQATRIIEKGDLDLENANTFSILDGIRSGKIGLTESLTLIEEAEKHLNKVRNEVEEGSRFTLQKDIDRVSLTRIMRDTLWYWYRHTISDKDEISTIRDILYSRGSF